MSSPKPSTPLATGRGTKSCPVCHDIDRNKIIYWKGGPSRHRMFKRYFQYSDYHSLPIPLKDLKFSASRDCQLCVIVFEIFRWLARTKAQGLNAIFQAKVEICIPFDARYPVVLTYSWLPAPNAPVPRQYDLQLAVPAKYNYLPWSTMNVGQHIPVDPRLSIFRSRSWLQDCLRHHDKNKCGSNSNGVPKSMPKRLAFLGNNQNQLRLVDSFGSNLVPYLALSYCWGQSRHIVTTSSNYDQHLRNIPWSLLPATYRDAIEFTRAVGYRYIWIDAICIVQDDKEDWSHEAANMADIYSEAVLVISATNANHVGFGFLNERSGSRTFKNKLKRGPQEPTHVLVQEPAIHSNIISNQGPEEHQWPVLRRAWTLQERMLATRLIHFAAGEIIWECASTCACECGHLESTNAVTTRKKYDLSSLGRMTDTERANLWDELALSYQNRLLTKEMDRLSALSGLAHRFQNNGLGDYLAGLWSNFVISMMLWEVKKGHKVAEHVAPSWSWASVQGRLGRNDPVKHNSSFQAILENCECQRSTTDPYGAIVPGSGFVSLISPVADGTIVRSERNGHPMVQLATNIQAFLVSDTHLKESQMGGTVKCLFPRGLETGPSGRYIEALVLSVSKDMNAYERIGIAHIQKHSLGETRHWQEDLILATETIRII